MRFLDPQSLAQHTDRLYRAAWALCGSPEDAEDLVQETLVRVLRRPRVLRGEASDLTYLMRALRNNFLTSRRDAARRPVAAGPLEEAEFADPRATREPQQTLEVRELCAAIAGLPEQFRAALVAIDMIGLSYSEASRSLGVPEGTVTTRLFRGRRLLALRFPELGKPKDPAAEHAYGTESVAGDVTIL
jgi:RNA polymerase sigma-70 factor (ECF subfamily)